MRPFAKHSTSDKSVRMQLAHGMVLHVPNVMIRIYVSAIILESRAIMLSKTPMLFLKIQIAARSKMETYAIQLAIYQTT